MKYEMVQQEYPIIDVKETGRKIKFFMWLNGISVQRLQSFLGLSCVQSIYRWFNGINLPSLDNMYAMSAL